MTGKANDTVLIYSAEHACFWRPNAEGYTKSLEDAGRYTCADARGHLRGAGPEKRLKTFRWPSMERVYLMPRNWSNVRAVGCKATLEPAYR